MASSKDFVAAIQVPSDHYGSRYDDLRRWSSYWWQLQLTSHYIGDGPILEVGIGNGITSTYLRNVLGADVTTVDLDKELKPDVVADVASLPFSDSTFSCVVACEVLEHTPYHHAERALAELRRVAQHAVISVPDGNRFVFRLRASLGSRHYPLVNWDFSRFMHKPKALEPLGQHYWELGRENTSVAKFQRSISSAGWSIAEQFRNPDFQYHHFFVLK